jgi:glucokinase
MTELRAVGLDVGGSSMRAAESGDAAAAIRAPVSAATTLAEFIEAAGGLLAAVDPGGAATVAVALPTFVKPDGTLLDCPSIPALTGVRLAALMATELGRSEPLLVPDLAAAVVGESRHGVGLGVDSFLCVALGTGANAAATRGGRVVDTAFGCLGDAGHVLVEPDGPRCSCGGRGCLEAVASGWALAREARVIGLRTGEDLTVAAEQGREDAAAILDRAGVALGRAVASWSALLWPEVVAVAGGVSLAGERLLTPARRELARVGVPYIAERVTIVPATLGETATLVGALCLAEDAARAT